LVGGQTVALWERLLGLPEQARVGLTEKWFSVLPRLKPCRWQDSTGGISQFQPAFNSINPGSQLVESDLLPGVGFITISDFTLDAPHGALKAGHSQLQIRHVVSDLIHARPNVAQVFYNKVIGHRD
jgi:hypothetical protein